MMDLNMTFHEEARKQVFNINQVSLNNIPLKSVIQERELLKDLACFLASFAFLQRDTRERSPGFPSP